MQNKLRFCIAALAFPAAILARANPLASEASIQDVYQGGQAVMVYTDGQKASVPLVPYAIKMKWGP
jgi:hypothetical protein